MIRLHLIEGNENVVNEEVFTTLCTLRTLT